MYSENYKLIVERVYSPYLQKFFPIFCISNITHFPLLRSNLIDCAYLWLSSNGLDPISDNLVFVHIRRGDYLRWPSPSSPAVLALSWYLNAIEHMKRSFPDAIFVLMGDDVMYLEDIAGLLPDCFVSHNSPHTDFALMTLCHHGILSASSFAWWGSTYASITINFNHFILPQNIG